MKPSRSEFIPVRGLQYHVRHWGSEGAPKLFMTHGWMDVSASFQFVVDCLQDDWHVIAPDWRGFGMTENSGADCYWFPDYLGDLDAILQHYSPEGPVNLLGHSMGGNVSCVYAGVRPERVAKLVNLEGFGMGATRPEQAPQRYAKWLDELRTPSGMRPYASREDVIKRLQKNNPRLTNARADFLSRYWAAENAQGEWVILGDPAHKLTNPVLYRIEEILACWERIVAPVLWVEADDTTVWRLMGAKDAARAEIDRRIKYLRDVTTAIITDASHMLHHDQPEALAVLIEQFLRQKQG
ncbi:alpha/beta fold hydrolase [Noviherbaspirillum denitrificans]|uniref:Alpha/beta hydrolase n=1 Tax=Noviherbaspirillum denitrificans TaxID=1968433 RepID=A0A254TJH1_9BURK|nr:alpha/beta hydrolase [Noviherbaspirillum denitrificans]OWW22800.1 alpha/beta hydrolase [Noviherbaspirillum denitrificans]